MKKLLAISIALNAGLAVGLFWKELTAEATGGGGIPAGNGDAKHGIPIGNGDVNADGSIDITDAIYLLVGIFLGGEPPVPIRIPATGETKCYDGNWQEIPCDDPVWRGQDGFYRAGCPMAGRYRDDGDGTVADLCTGLMWQKESPPAHYTWAEALRNCEDLALAGYSDWRLPNVRELESIVDYGRGDDRIIPPPPAIDPVFGAEGYWYWTSTTETYSPDDVFGVHFAAGGSLGSARSDEYCVRAVRGGL